MREELVNSLKAPALRRWAIRSGPTIPLFEYTPCPTMKIGVTCRMGVPLCVSHG
jgi:hypothetical protein